MDLLDRLYGRLTDALSASPSSTSGPLTIGDLYLRLIPYRAVRGDLGVLELAEYEHALLRLLGGERGYAELDEPAVLEEIQRELASVNPILGIYRDYVGATLTLPRAPEADASDTGGRGAPEQKIPASGAAPAASPVAESEAFVDSTGPSAEAPAASRPLEPDAAPAAASPAQANVRAAVRPPPEQSPPLERSDVAASPNAPLVCGDCARPLPSAGGVRFCPYCGSAQGPKPCPRCGTPLEGGWSFCIQCGAQRVS